MFSDTKTEHIRGRYLILATIITVIGSLIGATFAAKFAPIELNVNLDNYTNKVEEEIITAQNAVNQEALESLKENMQLQIDSLKKENNSLKKQIEGLRENLGNTNSTLSNADPLAQPNTETPPIKLTSLTVLGNNWPSYNYVYNSLENSNKAKSNLNDTFNSSICMRHNGNIDFYLGRKYQSLNAIICISSDTKNIDKYLSTLTICSVTGNGTDEEVNVLYTSPSLTMGFIPSEIGSIDVSEVEHLRISFFADGHYNNVPRIILGNPELIPK